MFGCQADPVPSGGVRKGHCTTRKPVPDLTFVPQPGYDEAAPKAFYRVPNSVSCASGGVLVRAAQLVGGEGIQGHSRPSAGSRQLLSRADS
jgi:hypothetical protein